MQNLASSEVQNFSILLKAQLRKLKEMEKQIEKRNKQISTLSKEISKLRESSKMAQDQNKILMETVAKKESKIYLLMKTNSQLKMENYDQENARKLENHEKDVKIKALKVKLGSIRKEKDSVEEELGYTLEELEVARSDPNQATKNLEDTIKRLEERNDELEGINKMNQNKVEESEKKQKEMEVKYLNEILSLEEKIRTAGSSISGSGTDNANDSIDDLLKSDSEDEDRDRSCSIRQVKVCGRTFKSKRSAETELYSWKTKKGRQTSDLLELMDQEINKMRTQ